MVLHFQYFQWIRSWWMNTLMLSPNIEGRWDDEQAGCTVVRSVEGRPEEIFVGWHPGKMLLIKRGPKY